MNLGRVKRRAAYYVIFIAILILISSVVYDVAMKTFEPGPYPPGETEISLLHSMQVVVETFTATGYGSDSPWRSTELNILIMLLDLTGVALFFVALPAILLPLFQEALASTVPTQLERDLQNHIIVCSDNPRMEALIHELESAQLEYVLIEPNRERVAELNETGHTVIHGDPESGTTLQRANITTARALVTDFSDQVDASVVLAADAESDELIIVSVVEDPDIVPYHRLAGADHVLTPRRALGESLAAKITTLVQADVGDTIEIGDDFELAELLIRPESELRGRTLGDSNLREQYGVNVIGAWVRGEFETPPPVDLPLERGTILLVTGQHDALNRLKSALGSPVRNIQPGETIIAGYGTVGQIVATALSDANIPYTVVDKRDTAGIDVVGDATDPAVLREAGIESATAVVLALPDDTVTEFATLVIQDIAPGVEILARAQETDAVQKTYRAGADYVLSLATVTGRSIVSQIQEETVLALDTNVHLFRHSPGRIAGQTLRETAVRDQTGCTIVAIEREDRVLTELDPSVQILATDDLILAGTATGKNRFIERYASAQ